MDSMSLVLYMSPVAAAALVPAAILLEPDCIAAARELSAHDACALSVMHECEYTANMGVGRGCMGKNLMQHLT